MAIESKLMQLLPADYGYVMFVGVGSTFVNMWLAINVSRARERYNIPVSLQGSKLGCSCGPSLPKLLSDHQIVLGGGPLVYWKTHHKRTVCLVNIVYIARIVKMLYTRKGKSCQLCLIRQTNIDG